MTHNGLKQSSVLFILQHSVKPSVICKLQSLMYLFKGGHVYERRMELGQVGDARKGGHIECMAGQLFQNRGSTTERHHNGARVDSLVAYENKSVLIITNVKK